MGPTARQDIHPRQARARGRLRSRAAGAGAAGVTPANCSLHPLPPYSKQAAAEPLRPNLATIRSCRVLWRVFCASVRRRASQRALGIQSRRTPRSTAPPADKTRKRKNRERRAGSMHAARSDVGGVIPLRAWRNRLPGAMSSFFFFSLDKRERAKRSKEERRENRSNASNTRGCNDCGRGWGSLGQSGPPLPLRAIRRLPAVAKKTLLISFIASDARRHASRLGRYPGDASQSQARESCGPSERSHLVLRRRRSPRS